LEGSLGGSRLFLQEAGLLGGVVEGVLDLGLVEDAAGDQGVEVAGGAPELVVAAASGCGGDGGGLLLEGALSVGMAGRGGPDGWRWRVLDAAWGQQLLERGRDVAEGCVDAAAGDPSVAAAGVGMGGGWGHDVAVGGAVVDVVQDADLVGEAGGGHVDVPAA
jgi:hypothetical protein